MANLLDEASILLTPTAYNNGSMLAVKPENGDGDFTFSRNSAATRVNAQGLVENVQILSSNLVSNGDFSQEGAEEVSNGSFSQEGSELVTNGSFATDSDWTKQTSWSISGGSANYDFLSDSKYIRQTLLNGGFVAGKTYKINFEITSGTAYINVNSNAAGLISLNTYSVGSYSIYVTPSISASDLLFYGRNTSGTAFSITNISVKEVGQDWALGTGWSIGEGKALYNGVSEPYLYNLNPVNIAVGDNLKITFVLDSNAKLRFVNENGSRFSGTWVSYASGTHEVYLTSSIVATQIGIQADTDNGAFGITNISVKEVGQDWTLGTGWSIGEDKAISDGSGFGALSSSYSNFNSKKLKVNFDILNYVSGEIRVPPSYRQDGLDIRYSANGSYELIYDSINSAFALNTVNFNGSVTNISVIEITDDTNLSRINYEGFSYQDSLGSEEVVNGDFATDTNWSYTTGWEISDGKANFTNISSKGIYQAKVLDANKTYKVSFDYNGTGQVGFLGTAGGGNTLKGFANYSNGNNVIYITPTTTTSAFNIWGNWTGAFSIDNVSVKEYLGQEVVPNSGCGSWLMENQATNLIPQSETFIAGWSKINGVLVSATKVTSPDGTLNASQLIYDGTNNGRIERAISGLTQGADYSVSVYARVSSGTQVVIFGSVNDFEYTLTSQWQRLTSTQAENDTVAYPRLRCDDAVTIEIWGFQLEQNSFSTSYIPTQGAISTRLQDIANNSGNASLINSEEGVLYAEISAFISLEPVYQNRYITLTNNTSNQRIALLFGGNNNQLRAIAYSNTQNINLSFSTTLTEVKQFNKLAIKFKSGDYAFFLNGVKIGGSSEINIFPANTLNDLSFDVGGGTQKFFGKNKAVAVFKTALTDEQLTLLTTI